MGIPNFINCDNELKTHAEYCERTIIKLYFSDPNDINKNAVITKVNRTIAQLLEK